MKENKINKISIIGAGRLGFSIAKGLIKSKQYQPSDIILNRRNVELLKEVQEELTYILPDNLLGIIWKGRYKGQKQKWYIMRFIGNEKEINIKTDHPEFLDWKWIKVEELTKVAVSFKSHIYSRLKSEIENYLINS